MTLNSGDKHLFITTDWGNLSKVVTQLYGFIESKEDGVYFIKVTDNSIKIEGNMTGGVAATGTKNTTISSNTQQSSYKV